LTTLFWNQVSEVVDVSAGCCAGGSAGGMGGSAEGVDKPVGCVDEPVGVMGVECVDPRGGFANDL